MDEDWTQGSGFISADLIEKYCPNKPSDDTTGPGPMSDAMTKILKEKFGFKKENYFCF
jgi:hypothetical protein